MIDMKRDLTKWHKWFAWYPIIDSKNFVWLKFVERRYVHWIDRELLLKDKPYRYRRITKSPHKQGFFILANLTTGRQQ